MRVLLVEDDDKIETSIARALKENSFAVDCSGNGAQARQMARVGYYDLAIVDLMLPGRDGLSVIEALRKEGLKTPVLVLSAKRSVNNRVRCLEAADDYLTKPFAFSELLARMRALLRRTEPAQHASKLTVGDLTLNLFTHYVERGEERIELHPREFALLELLIRNVGQPLSKKVILEAVWGYRFEPQTNVVDVLVATAQQDRQGLRKADAEECPRWVMFWTRFKCLGRSVTFRLTAWYAAIFGVSLLVVFALVDFALAASRRRSQTSLTMRSNTPQPVAAWC
jgi:two-component system OmpR family response regulator